MHEIVPFFEAYYSHVFYIVYDAFITAEVNLRQKGAHKAQREELEAVLYLFEKVRICRHCHLNLAVNLTSPRLLPLPRYCHDM